MKKIFACLLTLLLIAASLSAFAAAPVAQEIALSVGTMRVYDFGEVKLHAYETGDLIADENFILETADGLVLIELIGFYDNLDALAAYIEDLGKPLTAVIVAYHPAGADVFAGVPTYASEGLGEAGLVAGFVEAFGAIFDGNMPTAYQLVQEGEMVIGGLTLNIIPTSDAFDIEIPALNIYFTHMLGSQTHNILASMNMIDAMIDEMKVFQAKGYDLIFTGHDIPRTIDIAAEKIDYLETTKALAEQSGSAEEFVQAMKDAFPGYYGDNYLEMSAGALFAGQ